MTVGDKNILFLMIDKDSDGRKEFNDFDTITWAIVVDTSLETNVVNVCKCEKIAKEIEKTSDPQEISRSKDR